MTKNPILNALGAVIYISLVASLMFYGSQMDQPADSVLMPITMLSLFVLSAAMMAYIFCFEPIKMYLDGEKKAAGSLFLKTIGAFAVLTLLAFSLMILV